MNLQEAISTHQEEVLQLKAQLYDAQKHVEKAKERLIELGGIIAALQKAEEMNKESDDGPV